ncbi:CPBP family intramembrane glutamic endopeptidase [Streptomyces sp. RPT161]|uniref:CPBP family intramembrane glutamic endopeptidase n=1 Tax=Streptomyces sp. RPT161 TaxID=3015993 RepID=UPI0022B8D081|nr:CPBP family intramembrane glutamic endopeptidase [Streptomyces sp. RPT161]
MHAYLVAVLVLWGLAPMALASHLHGRWIEPKAPQVPALAPYFVIMSGLVVLGLRLEGPGMLTDGWWPGLVASVPLGYLIGRLAWHTDRRITARLAGRWGAAGRPRAHRASGPGRPVGIAADGKDSREVREAVPSNRWSRTEQARETRVGLWWLVVGAVLEEMVYRGALGHIALRIVPWPLGAMALAAVSVTFALSHLPFGWGQAIAKLPLSVFTLAATLATGSVLAAVIGHTWFNVRVFVHYQTAFGSKTAGRRPR